MPYPILSNVAASISELKANPMKTVASGHGAAIAVLNRNEPAFYCVPAATYEAMIEALEDAELVRIVREREKDKKTVKVNIDDL